MNYRLIEMLAEEDKTKANRMRDTRKMEWKYGKTEKKVLNDK